MPIVILFIAGGIILVVWLAVRNSLGAGHPTDQPRTGTGGDGPYVGADGHILHHHPDQHPHADGAPSNGSDVSGGSGSGDSGGGDCGGGGGDGGGGGGGD